VSVPISDGEWEVMPQVIVNFVAQRLTSPSRDSSSSAPSVNANGFLRPWKFSTTPRRFTGRKPEFFCRKLALERCRAGIYRSRKLDGHPFHDAMLIITVFPPHPCNNQNHE